MPILRIFVLFMLSSMATAEGTALTTPSLMAMGMKHQTINKAPIADSEYQLAIQRSSINLPIGKYDLLGQMFIPQVAIEQSTFELPNPNFNEKTLYSIKLPMLFIEKYNDNWTRVLNITPSWHTDLEAKDEQSYSLMGLILWRYKDESPHSYTVGAGINRLFGEYKPIPMVAYSYQSSPQTRYDLGFPVTKIEHRANQNWSVFSAIVPLGGNWRYEAENNQRINLSYSSWVATFGVRRNLVDKFWLTLEAGKSFERKIDLNNDSATSQEVSIANANMILFSIGLHP
ncbi:MAG: hypothetical protein ACI8SR_002563 [Oceanicoccus sp.]|jgi:hypothetical protein